MIDIKEAERISRNMANRLAMFYNPNEAILLEALRKQIPQSVVVKKRTTGLGNYHYSDYYCPECGKQQKANTVSSRREQYGWFCEKCGQHLMWGEDE